MHDQWALEESGADDANPNRHGECNHDQNRAVSKKNEQDASNCLMNKVKRVGDAGEKASDRSA